jgi:hypothetical protein
VCRAVHKDVRNVLLRVFATDLDLYAITRAAGQIEDALGIAVHTLLKPRKRDKKRAAPQAG